MSETVFPLLRFVTFSVTSAVTRILSTTCLFISKLCNSVTGNHTRETLTESMCVRGLSGAFLGRVRAYARAKEAHLCL